MKLTLLDLERRYLDIYKEVEEAEGEITEELADALAINENDFEERIEAYSIMINEHISDAERLGFQKSAIERRIKAKNNSIAYLKEIIKQALIKTTPPTKTKAGLDSYKREFPNINVKLVSSPSQSVDVIDNTTIKKLGYGKFKVDFETNDEMVINRIKKAFPNMDIKDIYQPDKTLIGNKLKAGEVIDGTELVVNHNLKIS